MLTDQHLVQQPPPSPLVNIGTLFALLARFVPALPFRQQPTLPAKGTRHFAMKPIHPQPTRISLLAMFSNASERRSNTSKIRPRGVLAKVPFLAVTDDLAASYTNHLRPTSPSKKLLTEHRSPLFQRVPVRRGPPDSALENLERLSAHSIFHHRELARKHDRAMLCGDLRRIIHRAARYMPGLVTYSRRISQNSQANRSIAARIIHHGAHSPGD